MQTDAYYHHFICRFKLPIMYALFLNAINRKDPDGCCHSLLVSIVAAFLFPPAYHRVLVIVRLRRPWLLDLPLIAVR